MAKASGGTRPNREGGLKVGDDNFKGKTGMPQSLKTIENKAVYDAVMDAISRFHSVLGVLTKHNRAVGGIILHELGHAVWTSSMTGKKYQAAGKEIKELYRNFIQDKDKQFYGKYSHTSPDEAWAEICARSVSGYRDKYVDTVKHIIRKYGL